MSLLEVGCNVAGLLGWPAASGRSFWYI